MDETNKDQRFSSSSESEDEDINLKKTVSSSEKHLSLIDEISHRDLPKCSFAQPEGGESTFVLYVKNILMLMIQFILQVLGYGCACLMCETF